MLQYEGAERRGRIKYGLNKAQALVKGEMEARFET